MGALDRFGGVTKRRTTDEPTPKRAEARRLLGELRVAVDALGRSHDQEYERHTEPLLDTPREVQVEIVLELLAQRRVWGREASWERQLPAAALLNQILQRQLPFELATLITATESFARSRPYYASVSIFVGLLERSLDPKAVPVEMIAALGELERSLVEDTWGVGTQQDRSLKRRIGALRGLELINGIESGETWSDRALLELEMMPDELEAAWKGMLEHAGTARSSRPSQRWLKQAVRRCDTIRELEPQNDGPDPVAMRLERWFATVERPISDRNAIVLRGLVWAASRIDQGVDPRGRRHARRGLLRREPRLRRGQQEGRQRLRLGARQQRERLKTFSDDSTYQRER